MKTALIKFHVTWSSICKIKFEYSLRFSENEQNVPALKAKIEITK
jgi:hypothetical protein